MLKIHGFTVDKNWIMNPNVLVQTDWKSGYTFAKMNQFPEGTYALELQNETRIAFVASTGYRIVTGLPANGDIELNVILGDKEAPNYVVDYRTAQAEYEALVAANVGKGINEPGGGGGGGNNKPAASSFWSRISGWFLSHLWIAVLALLALVVVLIGPKRVGKWIGLKKS